MNSTEKTLIEIVDKLTKQRAMCLHGNRAITALMADRNTTVDEFDREFIRLETNVMLLRGMKAEYASLKQQGEACGDVPTSFN